MKKYEYDGSVKQQSDVICYAFSPDLLDASEKDLKNFLKVLSQYFPKTENGDDGYEPMGNKTLLENFNSAHRNVCELISAKREHRRHRWLLGVSIATFLVLSITLGHSVYVQNHNVAIHQEPLNKSMQPTSNASAD